jgi:alpha-acetolactate decarboxylase/thiamine pyrophosphate-dependent enzyme
MPKIIADIPTSLNSALDDEIVRIRTDGSSIVTAALAQYLKTPVHTLFQVSTSGALVAGVYAGIVSVQSLLQRGDFGLGTFANLDGEMVVLESGRPVAAYVNLPKDIMTNPCAHDVLPIPAYSGLGPANSAAITEAARLINSAENPVVLLGLLASKPANAAALRDFIGKNHLPVVGTFQAAGAVAAHLFENFGGRVGQLV